VTAHGWDPRTRQEIVGRAQPEGETGEGARRHGGQASIAIAGHDPIPPDTATAEAMARGRMRRLAEGFVTAQMDLIGDPRIVPGALLKLEKLDDAVDGTYRVEQCFASSRLRLSIWADAIREVYSAELPRDF